jgi:methylmalonyl-CoA mutase C-terminal domain/subunit
MSERKIRVLVAKPGLDGHDRGAKVVARALRDAGMEVIYTGLRQTPEMIAEAALQEDVDVVGLSILSGAHMALVPRLVDLLKANGQEHVRVFVGGIIPDEDVPRLMELGVVGVYGPGTLTEDIIRDISQMVPGGAVSSGVSTPESNRTPHVPGTPRSGW